MYKYKTHLKSFFSSAPKIRDSISLGLLGGLLGTLPLDILNLAFWKNKQAESLYGQMAGSIIMKGFQTKRRSNFLFGQIVHMLTGAMAGIPMVYLFKLTGKDHQASKGAAYGFIVWAVYYVFGIRIGAFHAPPKKNSSHFMSLGMNILFGVLTAKSVGALAHPSVFAPDRAPAGQSKTSQDSGPDPWNLPQYTDSDYQTERPVH